MFDPLILEDLQEDAPQDNRDDGDYQGGGNEEAPLGQEDVQLD